jgi:hypothetical protein
MMFLARNRLHTIRHGRTLLSRHYVLPRPVPAASATPVEKILLDTIKVRATFDFLYF